MLLFYEQEIFDFKSKIVQSQNRCELVTKKKQDENYRPASQ
jgi:hypothetical protein